MGESENGYLEFANNYTPQILRIDFPLIESGQQFAVRLDYEENSKFFFLWIFAHSRSVDLQIKANRMKVSGIKKNFFVVYSGDIYILCNTCLDICSIKECKNNGTCVPATDNPKGFECLCDLKFQGPDCSERNSGCKKLASAAIKFDKDRYEENEKVFYQCREEDYTRGNLICKDNKFYDTINKRFKRPEHLCQFNKYNSHFYICKKYLNTINI